jgi:integrase/recombinase XerC
MLPRGAQRSDAYDVAAAFDRAAFQIKMGQIETAITIKEAVNKWFLTAAKCFTDRTKGHYAPTMKKFMQFLPQSALTVDQITARDINDYIETILKDRTARTANSQLTTIKSFCRWYSRTYDLSNPASRVDFLKEEPPNHRFLVPDEYQKILSVSDDDTADIFRLLANTGLRASEFCGLKWCDIDLEQDSISIIGKGRKRRTIPINQTVRNILQKMPQNNEYVFPSQNPKFPGISINRRTLYDFCIRAAERAAIPAFGAHALRHFFATELLNAGAPIVKVSLIMGHANVKITQQVYAHIMPGDLKGVTNCLDDESKPATDLSGVDTKDLFQDIKKRSGAAMFFLQSGELYETFFEDAEMAHSLTGLPIVNLARNGAVTPVLAIPRFAFEPLLSKLFEAGDITVCQKYDGKDVLKTYKRESA